MIITKSKFFSSIKRKLACFFFISIDSVSKSLIIFQKKIQVKITMGSMACERNGNKEIK
jgi:hypothetical protein